jgi:hypothetical protein
MIAWAIPGTGWATWFSITAASGRTSGTTINSNGGGTTSTSATEVLSSTVFDSTGGSTILTENTTYQGGGTGGGPQSRFVVTSTTETEGVEFVSTSLAVTDSTQHTISTLVPLGSNSTTTVTFSAVAQITASLPVAYVETTTRTNTVFTQLTETENNNGPDLTVYQAVGNEVLWVHPLTPVAAYFVPYAASDAGYTTTEVTIFPRTETVSLEGRTTAIELTNAGTSNPPLSFQSTRLQTTTVTSASGNSMPMPTFTRTFRYQTTTTAGTYQFSIEPATIVAGGGIAGSTTKIFTGTILTSISKSYQFGTYAAAYPSTTSFSIFTTGPWAVENSFTYEGVVGPSSALTNTTFTDFSAVDGAAYAPVMLQGGFGLTAGLPIFGEAVSLHGGSRAAFAGSQSGAYFTAADPVFFQIAAHKSQRPIFDSVNPQSVTLLPTLVEGMAGSGANTTQYSVSWSGPSYTATSKNSVTDNTNTTYSGVAGVAGDAVAASTSRFAIAAFPVMRIGGYLPDGITGVAGGQENLVKIGTGTDTTTSMIGGQTTWSGSAPPTFIEPISSVVINPFPSFGASANETVWAVSKYKDDPFPPYSLPEV